MIEQSGCAQCTAGAYSGTWPPPERIATLGGGWAFLHRCSFCGTYWEFNVREAHPISETEGERLYRLSSENEKEPS